MKLIKLNAIDSTNSFLKDLAASKKCENFTIVVAENQTNGKGQRGATWNIESGKNLTFSVLYNNNSDVQFNIFTLNIIVAISIIEGLQQVSSLDFKIKWPNDILAENKKIAGILIENSIKNQSEIQSIIGIGINVNQENFKNLPQASSLRLLENYFFDKDLILKNVVNQLEYNLNQLNQNSEILFWEKYHAYLFKKNVVSTFEDSNGNRFVGKIIKVTFEGKLNVLLENDTEINFDIKEIKMLF
jgi:BirA family biotin operon repressor/biotin-[acetyl-CoA-carboxylase] ligase